MTLKLARVPSKGGPNAKKLAARLILPDVRGQIDPNNVDTIFMGSDRLAFQVRVSFRQPQLAILVTECRRGSMPRVHDSQAMALHKPRAACARQDADAFPILSLGGSRMHQDECAAPARRIIRAGQRWTVRSFMNINNAVRIPMVSRLSI